MKSIRLLATFVALGFVAGCAPPRPQPDGATPVPAAAIVTPPPPVRPATLSSFDRSGAGDSTIAAHMIRFQEADLAVILDFYQELSGRTLIRSPQLPMTSKITVENNTQLTRVEALQMLDNVFAAQGVVMVYLGNLYVKAVPAAAASGEAGLIFDGPWRQLPDSSSFVTYIFQLKTLAPEDAVSILAPYAKLPNSILGVKGSPVMILRDYSANVRRMMEVLEKVEGTPLPPNRPQ